MSSAGKATHPKCLRVWLGKNTESCCGLNKILSRATSSWSWGAQFGDIKDKSTKEKMIYQLCFGIISWILYNSVTNFIQFYRELLLSKWH